MPHDLLTLSREIKGLAETGLRYGDNAFDRERYQRLHQIASELLSAGFPDFEWPVEFGYPTPKLDIRAAVINAGRILMVRESANGLWTLPGGWADADNTPSENAVREVREESGYRVEATRLLVTWDKARHGHPREIEYVYRMVFACTLIDGEPKLSHEIDAIDWFDPDHLPPLCPQRCSKEYIDVAFDYFEHPELPTSFD